MSVTGIHARPDADAVLISSYDSCDVGTLVNQTNPAGTGPPAALNSGGADYGGILSYQPGQRLSYVAPTVSRFSLIRFLLQRLYLPRRGSPWSQRRRRSWSARARSHRSVSSLASSDLYLADHFHFRQVSYIDGGRLVGSVSQSAQFAPYDAGYIFRNSSPQTVVYNRANTYLNEYLVRSVPRPVSCPY